LAVESLKKLGYKNVKYIEGGFKKWELTYPLMQEKNLEEGSGHQVEEVGGC
jgi:3-mercaptopyruvate sulfurtransferase SseA